MVDELDDLTRELAADGAVGAVVIVGAREGLFVTHYDVRQLIAGAEATSAMTPRRANGALRALGLAERLPGARAALRHTPAAGAMKLRQLNESSSA
jgi:enoyl-CoA hydratase